MKKKTKRRRGAATRALPHIHRNAESKVFAAARDSSISYADDIAFHMTDWFDDLERLRDLLLHPDDYTDAQANKVLLGFLLHAPNHIAAAYKIWFEEPIHDVWSLGIHLDGPPDPSGTLTDPEATTVRPTRKKSSKS